MSAFFPTDISKEGESGFCCFCQRCCCCCFFCLVVFGEWFISPKISSICTATSIRPSVCVSVSPLGVCMHIIELNAFLFVKVESNNSNIQSLIQFHLCNNNMPVGRTDGQAGRGRERTLSDIAESISLRCRAFHTHTHTNEHTPNLH